jgi:hypothetical protein
MVRQFAPQEIAPHPASPLSRFGKSAACAIGLGAAIPSLKRSPYDDFMMRFHNFLKENPRFQADCPKYPFQFPPGSSWMVYTDTVPHAVLAGQYALEQTFLVRPEAMVRPEISPLRILEEIQRTPPSGSALRVSIRPSYSAVGAFAAGAVPGACFAVGFVSGSDPQYWGSAAIQDFST